tara:strand:- start:488 stop:889 length:402 start_codon:yes stop_codon:yes gene_type:complete
MMKYALTKRQSEAYAFIRTYVKEKGMSPTYEEIASALGLSSRSQSHDVVRRLQARGYITYLKGQGRSITIVTDDMRDEQDLRAIKIAAALFIQTQEKFRSEFDEDQTSESTLAAGARVSKTFNDLKILVEERK